MSVNLCLLTFLMSHKYAGCFTKSIEWHLWVFLTLISE